MKKSNTLISVLIPAYNHENYVQSTLLSIIHQTYKDLELVILNDGSVDGTDAKIREMLPLCETRFSRVVYIPKNNEGIPKTLNRGIDLCHGEFIYVTASDDIVKPEAITVLHDFLKKNLRFAMAAGDDEIIDETGKRCYWDANRNNVNKDKAVHKTFAGFLQTNRPDFDFLSGAYGTYRTLIRGNYITEGQLFRKKCLLAVGKLHPTLKPEDWYLNLKLSKRYRIKFINQILFSYRWHATNTIKRPEYATIDEVLEFEKKNDYFLYHWYMRFRPALKKIFIRLIYSNED